MNFRFKHLLVMAALLLGLCWCGDAAAAERWKGTFWIPEGVSSYSKDIDALFYFILFLTGVVFIGTEACLLIFMIKYRKKEGQKSFYTHGNHKLEMIWTITPAVTLIFIALIQAKTWKQIKDDSTFLKQHGEGVDKYVHVQLFAEQFDWHFRYPAIVEEADKSGKVVPKYKYGVKGSFTADKRLVVPKDKPVVVEMTSKDVIHSFFLPYMRLKQDVVPGMHIRCWFDANKTTREMRETYPKMPLMPPKGGDPIDTEWDYPIVCAELCGIQHYQMAGSVEVLEQNEYDQWVKEQRKIFDPAADDAIRRDENKIFATYWKVDPVTQQRLYGDEYENRRQNAILTEEVTLRGGHDNHSTHDEKGKQEHSDVKK